MSSKGPLKTLEEKPLQVLPPNYLKLIHPILGYMNTMIQQRGSRAILYHSTPCPCVDVSEYGGTGQPASDCVSCGGFGLYFLHEDPHELRVLVSGLDAKEANVRAGTVGIGTVRITMPPGYYVGGGDKFVFPDSRVIVPTIRIFKKVDGYISLPFDAVDIESAVTKSREPRDPVVILKRGKDYGLDRKNRRLVINDQGAVHDGMVVSFSSVVIPEYIVSDVTSVDRQFLTDTDDSKALVTRLPKNVMAERADLFFDTGAQRG